MKRQIRFTYDTSAWFMRSITLLTILTGLLISANFAVARTTDINGQVSDPAANPNNPDNFDSVPFPVSNVKIYHGSQCQYVDINNVNTPEFYNNPVKYDTHGIINQDAAATHVVCPVVRDNATNTTGILGAEVSVNNIANDELWCEFVSRDRFGDLIDLDQDSTLSGGNRILSMDINASSAQGNFSIYCKIPRDARIYSYSVSEKLRTDFNNGF